MFGGTGGAVSPAGEDVLTVTVVRDEHGYGMKVSGDNPVYVQSVKEHGPAWRAGLRSGDRILRVDCVSVVHHTHQEVVHMIKENPTMAVLTVQQSSRHKRPITAPVPVNPEKQRQLEKQKAETVQLMLEKELKYIRDLRNELLKVPDVRKQAELESAEQRCLKLQHKIDSIMAGQLDVAPSTPRPTRSKDTNDKPTLNTGFLSGLPRSLSNLTGQSLRNLRQARQNKFQQENQPPLHRQNSDDAKKRHNNTVPMVPTTCLDSSPPPLPPRSIERPKRNPLTPPVTTTADMKQVNPLAMPKPSYYKYNPSVLREEFRRSSHSLDGELDGPQPNSIALQMSYPLVNVPPPPLLSDNRNSVPVMHIRSQSSPEHLDHELPRTSAAVEKEAWSRGTPPPGTPPPPYPHSTQPCSDPQRAIISMEEDDVPSSENTTYAGLFSNLRTVRDSKARMAVLINWLLGERRCPCASLVLVLTDAFRAAGGVPAATLRRWAYEIHSVFLMPNAVLHLNGVDENMANEIEHVLVNEFEKEDILRNVFRKARRQAKDELSRQLSEFQLKRQLGLATLYGPDDNTLQMCDVDKTQEVVVVERIMCSRLRVVSQGGAAGPCGTTTSTADAHAILLAALVAAALCLHCRPASVAAAVGGSRPSFLQRDKLYKQRLKQLIKQHPQPFIVRGHHLQLRALTSVAHCHHCDMTIGGLAPQAVVCTDCKLRLHRECVRKVEETCCLDGEHHNNRISRFMERIHPNNMPSQDSTDRKSRKSSGTANFLNMERSFRRLEDEPNWEQTLTPIHSQERRDESDESLYESADCQSDVISASDDALPRLGKTPTMSKESLKLAVTDEEGETRLKKGHRKTMSLSNPLEIVKTLGDEWFDHKKEEKNCDKKKSRESLWSEEDSLHGSNIKLDNRKNSKKDDKNEAKDAKRKSSKGSSVSSFNFLRRKKTPTSMKPVLDVVEVDGTISPDEILKTKLFLEEEKRFASISQVVPVESDSEDEIPTKKVEHRRRLSRQTSRSKSKVRGKSQSVKVNTLRKSHSGTLKKAKKKSVKAPLNRSRQASIADPSPIVKKKHSETSKPNSWLFSASRGESRREGSTEEHSTPDIDNDAGDSNSKEVPEKEHNWRGASATSRGVNRAESCRERDAPRRGKHRNASDPNRLTAHPNHDLEPGAGTAPSGSSSSSSLSSRSNESGSVAAEQQEWSDEEEPLAAQWSDSLPPGVRDTIVLSARLRKRQEVIHELIVSEGSHVRWLKVLGGDFLRPLERQSTLLPPEELRALFPNLPSVKERHLRLYSELRTARNEAPNHVVQIRPIADVMLNTLGETGYAACLSKFCRGQRMALEALRERRRKNKDLHQFLAGREQLPRCGRLQLRDLLACVWQRLTKYQLLLEGILKTVTEDQSEDDPESEEDIAQLRRALNTAKDVLHSVDTAIRTAENEHRLRTIQNKLEVRAPMGLEWEELRRLELPQHALRMEGELLVRTDTKKMSVLALMLEDSLVLLQREADRFLLKPIAHSSQNTMLSPLIKWDKVLFRPNAAMRNTFFLMNINGFQMHELSANTAAEYSTWMRLIQESRLAETKPTTVTSSHQHTRSTDDSGINVSRNPSDASEKSTSSAPPEETCDSDRDTQDKDKEREKETNDNTSTEPEREKASSEREEKTERMNRSISVEKEDGEDKHRQGATVGCITTHMCDPETAGELVEGAAVTVRPPLRDVLTTQTVLSHTERLRRLDEAISQALQAKSAVVAELLGVPPDSYSHMAELAIVDMMGQGELSGDLCPNKIPTDGEPDVHQLLLAAQAQANQLTETLSSALSLSETSAVRARSGRCDSCRNRTLRSSTTAANDQPADNSTLMADEKSADTSHVSVVEPTKSLDESFDLLTDVNSHLREPTVDAAFADDVSACGEAQLARNLVGVACGLQASLGCLVAALPALHQDRAALRASLAAARERAERLAHDKKLTEDMSFPKDNVDQSIQDQPSNGG